MTEIPPDVNPITARIRGMAKVWSLLVFVLALILILMPRRETALKATQTPIDRLIPLALLISMLGLAIAWRSEGLGTLINLGFYLAVVPIYRLIHNEWIHFSLMVGLSPVILPGVLFGVAWLLDWRAEEN